MNAASSPYENLEHEEEIEAIMSPGAGPAILDFWSETCGPCLAMADDFAHVAAQFSPEEVRFCKINTSTHGWLAAPFKIRSVPTILFVHDGKVLDAVVGKMDARTLGEKAEWLVKKASKKPGLFARLFARSG